MIIRFLMLVCVSLIVSGCATTSRTVAPANQLPSEVAELQQRLEDQEKEVLDLQYEVKELSLKLAEKKTVKTPVAVEPVRTVPVEPEVAVADVSTDNVLRATGVSVADLQKALKGAGLYSGNIDGKIGRQTRIAIIEFQKQHALKTDGIVGRQTWAAMKTYLPVE